MDYTHLISTIVGGVLSLSGVAIATQSSQRFTNRVWTREKKLELYRGLIQELLTVEIPCIASVEAIEKQQLILNAEALNKKLELLSGYIQNHLSEIFIFSPKGTYRELLKLQSEIYQIIKTPELQRIDFVNFKTSSIYLAVMHALEIAGILSNEILKKREK